MMRRLMSWLRRRRGARARVEARWHLAPVIEHRADEAPAHGRASYRNKEFARW